MLAEISPHGLGPTDRAAERLALLARHAQEMTALQTSLQSAGQAEFDLERKRAGVALSESLFHRKQHLMAAVAALRTQGQAGAADSLESTVTAQLSALTASMTAEAKQIAQKALAAAPVTTPRISATRRTRQLRSPARDADFDDDVETLGGEAEDGE